MDKPDVDFIEGLSPAISIDQKSASRNPRSTVGTVTEVYDYLRLLFARIGRPHCPSCGKEVGRQTPQQIVDQVLDLGEGTRLLRARPRSCAAARASTTRFSTTWPARLSRGCASTARSSSSPTAPTLDLRRYEQHTIEVVVDRLVRPRRDPPAAHRVRRDRACGSAAGSAEIASSARTARRRGASQFSEQLACTHCGISFDEPAPRDFSFNSPYGACPTCARARHPLRGRRRARRARHVALASPTARSSPWAGAGAGVLHRPARRGAAELGKFASTRRGEAAREGPQARSSRRRRHAGAGALQEPLRPRAQLRGDYEGVVPGSSAARRGRLGLVPRADRGLHARGRRARRAAARA